MFNLRKLCAVGLSPLFALAAAAQTSPPDWDKVRALASTTDIRVEYDNGKPTQGKVESTTDSSLTISPGAQSFSRTQIVSVSVKKNGHRVRNTFIGLGVGLAAGIGIGAASASRCHQGELCGIAAGAEVGIGGALGMIGGTVIGAVWPTGGWREMYRR
jgi:hypothetical protein